MALKKYRPITPSLRHRVSAGFDEITKQTPEKSLVYRIKSSGGRNSEGRRTISSRGGGHIRLYRKIDFKRDKFDIPGKVASIEYDPNRTARIALIHYKDGEKRYILAPKDLQVGHEVLTGEKVPVTAGNCMPLKNIPLGTNIHNIELSIGKGGQLVRSAGAAAVLMAREGKYAHVRLPSKEVRLINVNCRATIGVMGNSEHASLVSGKAGRTRWLGRRPHVRGVAKNPVDHPMGGGEGKSSGGRHPCTPWGIPTKGYKTRSKSKTSNKYIVVKRKGKK